MCRILSSMLRIKQNKTTKILAFVGLHASWEVSFIHSLIYCISIYSSSHMTQALNHILCLNRILSLPSKSSGRNTIQYNMSSLLLWCPPYILIYRKYRGGAPCSVWVVWRMFLRETCKQTSRGWENELMRGKGNPGGDETEHGLGPGPDETNECCWMNEGNFLRRT